MNNCVINWLTPWPEEALASVASVFLAEVDLPDELRKHIMEHIVMVHQSVCRLSVLFEEQMRRHNYVTPKNFLDFITNYRNLLHTNRKSNADMCKRLDGGLQKLIQAAQEVALMQAICAISM